jgi:hypothetical protein
MSYHGIGAGPGPVELYRVDMPFPWGDNTELKLPVHAIVQDALDSITEADAAQLVPWDSINRRVQASMPVWINQALAEAQPAIDENVNKALLKFAVITAALMGGAFYVAKRITR